jgi:UDP-N-acetylglucosamine:LPS N-acetylglucosamine transferase
VKKGKVKKIKVCIVCSSGGHLTEILQVKECFQKFPHFFITFKREDSLELEKKENVYFVENPSRNPIKFLRCLFQTFFIVKKEKPKVIISTGAGVAAPACFLGKLFFKSKIIFIESFCRIEEPSLSGKLIYPISDSFFVQWKKLLNFYGKKAVYRGSVV